MGNQARERRSVVLSADWPLVVGEREAHKAFLAGAWRAATRARRHLVDVCSYCRLAFGGWAGEAHKASLAGAWRAATRARRHLVVSADWHLVVGRGRRRAPAQGSCAVVVHGGPPG